MWHKAMCIIACAAFASALAIPTTMPAQACQDAAEVSAPDDDHLPVSITYYHCSNMMKWTFQWDRVGQDPPGSSLLEYAVSGAGVIQYYRSTDYNNGQHGVFAAEKWVGPQSQHTLRIARAGGSGVHFINLQANTYYWNKSPDLPDSLK